MTKEEFNRYMNKFFRKERPELRKAVEVQEDYRAAVRALDATKRQN